MEWTKGKLFAKQNRRNLITFSNPDSIISEEYRTIRTNILFSIQQQKYRTSTVLITSPSLNEGKSTTAANLAVSMAQQNDKILLIDSDLRKPSLHNIFKLRNTTGLTELLTNKATLSEAVIKTEIGKLDILTSGAIPNNPSELLGSEQMTQILNEVSLAYDVVILDSPPILEVTDTKLLANQCGSVVLVFKSKKTKLEKVEEAKKVLQYADANLIGAIINEK